ncbi:MAG: hypothetical protein DMG06_19220 [Acidobacteria bacterium]|nr:MAG: hypothetical protein DMG06_19220 [Acidobacteriota bacterium]
MKKLGGRASWRAIAPASPCPMRLSWSLALPIFSLPSQEGIFTGVAHAGAGGTTKHENERPLTCVCYLL